MDIKGWRYYNHAAVPTTAPHETVNINPVENGLIWKIKGYPLLARWTSEFDCKFKTNWWYIIKDTPFDINSLKSKRRYEINKGRKNFEVRKICPSKYVEELLEVQIDAFSAYPEKYRPTVDKEQFRSSIKKWNTFVVYGAFFLENDKLCGYAILKDYKTYVDFMGLKTKPAYEKYAINAAIVYEILENYSNRLTQDFYICDGSRSIFHETAFQDYLEKYFEFRKAYCNLNIKYNPLIGWIIDIIYPFRKKLQKFDEIGWVHQMNSVLRMEELTRGDK